mmetsp:Transcript_21433/g.55894  ORF Transcript_21433/g.55894 Transcript_21433/m.55894 type:complete len:243 (+) Transcript_21433:433-1161(+)
MDGRHGRQRGSEWSSDAASCFPDATFFLCGAAVGVLVRAAGGCSAPSASGSHIERGAPPRLLPLLLFPAVAICNEGPAVDVDSHLVRVLEVSVAAVAPPRLRHHDVAGLELHKLSPCLQILLAGQAVLDALGPLRMHRRPNRPPEEAVNHSDRPVQRDAGQHLVGVQCGAVRVEQLHRLRRVDLAPWPRLEVHIQQVQEDLLPFLAGLGPGHVDAILLGRLVITEPVHQQVEGVVVLAPLTM